MKPTLRRALALALVAAAAAAFALPGCRGYTHGFAMPPGAEGVKTIAVEIFKNKTLYTDIEFEFTRALQREICAKTPLKIAERGNADAVVSGAIEVYEKAVLRESVTDDVSRYSIVLTVSYEFRRLPFDGRPSKVITSSEKLKRSAEYEVMSRETEPDARAEAVRKIARKVVSHMFEKW